MGPIKSVIENLDGAEENKKKAKEALDIAIKLIQTRFDTFQSQLNLGVGPIEKVPGKYLIAMKRIISANVSKGTKQNYDAITGIVDDFARGQIAKGITNTLFQSLDMVLGSFSASYNQVQDYILLTNLIGGLYRIDYLVVQQTIQANAITNVVSNAFGSYLIISSINKKELDDDNLFRVLVDRQFGDQPMNIKQILVKQLNGVALTQADINEIQGLTYKAPPFQPPPKQISIEARIKENLQADANRLNGSTFQEIQALLKKKGDELLELEAKSASNQAQSSSLKQNIQSLQQKLNAEHKLQEAIKANIEKIIQKRDQLLKSPDFIDSSVSFGQKQ